MLLFGASGLGRARQGKAGVVGGGGGGGGGGGDSSKHTAGTRGYQAGTCFRVGTLTGAMGRCLVSRAQYKALAVLCLGILTSRHNAAIKLRVQCRYMLVSDNTCVKMDSCSHCRGTWCQQPLLGICVQARSLHWTAPPVLHLVILQPAHRHGQVKNCPHMTGAEVRLSVLVCFWVQRILSRRLPA